MMKTTRDDDERKMNETSLQTFRVGSFDSVREYVFTALEKLGDSRRCQRQGCVGIVLVDRCRDDLLRAQPQSLQHPLLELLVVKLRHIWED